MKKRNLISACLAGTILGLIATTASAQTELLAIEFNQDDQEGFDIWPEAIVAPSSTAGFSTDPGTTSGTTTVSVTTSTGFGLPGNRGGLVDGTPEGFTYSGLYMDLLHASSPTGVLTLDVSGLNAGSVYRFTLYAWDPGATDASDKEWTVTGGAADPSVISVNFQDPLVDNDTFALVFDITTTETGTFQVTNTNGLPQSAINGFKLEALGDPPSFDITDFDYSPDDSMLTLTWDSRPGETYAVRYSFDMENWDADLDDGIEADPEGETTTETFSLAAAVFGGKAAVLFRVERQPAG